MEDLVKKSLGLCTEINRLLDASDTHDATHASLMSALTMAQEAHDALGNATQNLPVFKIAIDVDDQILYYNAPGGLSP